MKTTFDIARALPLAWKIQWDEQLRRMKEKEFRAQGYLTATDMENQVRKFAEEQAEGKEWGSTEPAWGRAYMGRLRISLGGRRRLLDVCRDWLLDEVRAGRLKEHNFGRGHISGARFRPRGFDLGDSEKKTIETKEKHRAPDYVPPVHAALPTSSRPLCSFRPGRWFGGWRRNRARSSQKIGEVTCAACRNLIASPLKPAERREMNALGKKIEAWKYRSGTEAAVKKRSAELKEWRRDHTALSKRANAESFPGKKKGAS